MIPIDSIFTSWRMEPSIGAWESNKYWAAAYKEGDTIRLDINRKDMSSGMTWDELQAIKSACGFGEYDAVEYYPRDADVICTANIRHLYIFPDKLPHILRISNGAS